MKLGLVVDAAYSVGASSMKRQTGKSTVVTPNHYRRSVIAQYRQTRGSQLVGSTNNCQHIGAAAVVDMV